MLFRAILIAVLATISLPVSACVVSGSLDFRNIQLADVVLLARVLKVETIDMPVTHYDRTVALFHLRVDRLFDGPANITDQITVTVDVFDVEEANAMVGKDYIFALMRDFGQVRPKPKLDSALPWRPGHEVMTALQGPCGFGTFIFDAGGPVKRAVEMLYDGHGDAKAEAAFLAEYLQLPGLY